MKATSLGGGDFGLPPAGQQGVSPAAEGAHVGVTGVSSCEMVGEELHRLSRVRSQDNTGQHLSVLDDSATGVLQFPHYPQPAREYCVGLRSRFSGAGFLACRASA